MRWVALELKAESRDDKSTRKVKKSNGSDSLSDSSSDSEKDNDDFQSW